MTGEPDRDLPLLQHLLRLPIALGQSSLSPLLPTSPSSPAILPQVPVVSALSGAPSGSPCPDAVGLMPQHPPHKVGHITEGFSEEVVCQLAGLWPRGPVIGGGGDSFAQRQFQDTARAPSSGGLSSPRGPCSPTAGAEGLTPDKPGTGYRWIGHPQTPPRPGAQVWVLAVTKNRAILSPKGWEGGCFISGRPGEGK